MKTEREMFEGWVKSLPFNADETFKRRDNNPDHYCLSTNQTMWEAWQARAKAVPVPPDSAMPSPALRGGKTWQHAANEWADAATNGLQLLANVLEGVSTAEEAFALLKADIEHAREETPSIFKPDSADSDRRDAERYRYIRDKAGWVIEHNGSSGTKLTVRFQDDPIMNIGHYYENEFDKAIDAAMSAEGNDNG